MHPSLDVFFDKRSYDIYLSICFLMPRRERRACRHPGLDRMSAKSGRFGRKIGAMHRVARDIEARVAGGSRRHARPPERGSTINPETRGAGAARFSDGAQAIQ
ncbi:hypothetical protein [Burkholderia gladioli]|uniref:hypothetical protein n=1 Tax=Burkholderia gladioli TaxID=28095 RepID=UPI0015E6973A|nr:hypothetical protein [Burkholderia gladioli]MBA1363710.1 hypothetical protein [Burkholderia gladioli]